MDSSKKLIAAFATITTLACTTGYQMAASDHEHRTATALGDRTADTCALVAAQPLRREFGFSSARIIELLTPAANDPTYTICVQPTHGPEFSALFHASENSDGILVIGREDGRGKTAQNLRIWKETHAKNPVLGPGPLLLEIKKDGPHFRVANPGEMAMIAPGYSRR